MSVVAMSASPLEPASCSFVLSACSVLDSATVALAKIFREGCVRKYLSQRAYTGGHAGRTDGNAAASGNRRVADPDRDEGVANAARRRDRAPGDARSGTPVGPRSLARGVRGAG